DSAARTAGSHGQLEVELTEVILDPAAQADPAAPADPKPRSDSGTQADAAQRADPPSRDARGAPNYVATMPLIWGGKPEGSVSAYYVGLPDERVIESFSIIGAQFSAAAEATRFRTRDL